MLLLQNDSDEGGFKVLTHGKFYFITGEFLAGMGIDIFMKGIQFLVDIKEMEGDNGVVKEMGSGKFYKMELLGMKSGWKVYPLDCELKILAEVAEDDDGEVILPKPLARIFDEMLKTFLGRSLVVECEDSFDLKRLNPEEWSRFKREMWSIVVEQYKKGVYQEESKLVESEDLEDMDSEITMVEEEPFEVMSTWMASKEDKLRWKLPEEKGFETVDMR